MKKFLLASIILLLGISGYGQDANYWSAAYNPAGLLTPGSAVAFTGDSGVLYFNPALLAYNTKNSATISGSVYEFNELTITDGAGSGLPLRSRNLSVIPVMASNILAIRGRRNFTIGYAIIHNPVIAYQSTQQFDGRENVLNDSYSPGAENFLAQYNAQNVINETSAMLSAGLKLSSYTAFGISVEGLYRQQTYMEDYTARALINTNTISGLPPISNVEALYQINHYNASIKFKAGFAYDQGRSHFGVNITSPLVQVKAGAQLLSDYLITDLKIASDDTLNLLASTRQTGLKEKWKMPLSIALGYAYNTSWGQIYLSTEYFLGIKEYNIITPNNTYFLRTNSDSNAYSSSLLKFTDARRAILNGGIGISYNLKPDLTAYLALRTDFNFADSSLHANTDNYTSNTSHQDIYHLQIGGNLKRKKFNLRAGLLMDYGHTSGYPQAVNMTTANESNLLFGNTHPVKATYFSVGIMFAYVHNL